MDKRTGPAGHGQGPEGSPQSPISHWTMILWLFILFLLLGPWISSLLSSKGTQISYTDFRSQLEAGNVQKVTVQGEKISGQLKKPAEEKTPTGTDSLLHGVLHLCAVLRRSSSSSLCWRPRR